MARHNRASPAAPMRVTVEAMSAPASPSEHQHRPVLATAGLDVVPAWRVTVVGVVGLLVVLGQLYLVLPMLDLIADLPGASQAAAPLAVTMFALPYALSFLLLGPLADRYGARRLMIVSIAVVLAGSLAAALAPSWGWLLVARAVQGVGAAPLTPALLLIVATRVHPDRRLQVTSAIISAGMAAAVVAQVAAQVGAPIVGVGGMFVLSAAAMVGCLSLTLFLLPAGAVRATAGAPARKVVDVYQAIPRLLARRRLVLLLAVAVSYLAVFVGLYAAIQLAGPAGVAQDPARLLTIRASALPAMIAVPLVTPLLVRIPTRARLLASIGVGVVTTTLLGTLTLMGVHGAIPVVVAMLVIAAAIGIAAPATVTEVMANAPDTPGAANALYSAAIFGGASIGTPLAALIIATVGHDHGFGAFAFAAAACLTAAFVLVAAALRRAGADTANLRQGRPA